MLYFEGLCSVITIKTEFFFKKAKSWLNTSQRLMEGSDFHMAAATHPSTFPNTMHAGRRCVLGLSEQVNKNSG
jgi:hypothetical protein